MNSIVKRAASLVVVVAGLGALGAGCLARPVATGEPSTKTNFTNTVTNQVIDKLDILFDIDNSASMGDKQSFLAAAVPDLINRLVNPNCVDMNGANLGASNNGQCTTGTLEFQPVHDMHLGIVTSALGSRLSDATNGVCDPTTPATAPNGPFININAHNDDQAHLIARSLSLTPAAAPTTATEGSVANAVAASYAPAPGGFLWWYPGTAPPASPVPAENSTTSLNADFTQLVGGSGIFGCGIESQLESWYRFLVQPDPYGNLALDGNGHAQWANLDAEILKERKDFLRPDSLVAVIVLSDENDSEIDVRSLGGQAYFFMRPSWDPFKGTSACTSKGPADSNCGTCGNMANSGDSNCQGGGTYPKSNLSSWGYDMNLRHVHMKAKYGLDPQYPTWRYANGLTSLAVPDRRGEYGTDNNGSQTTNYVGHNNCTNPLFAAALPDPATANTADALCNLQLGPRTPKLVFYAIIGGVPNQLLHFDPMSPGNSVLSDADWKRILGNGQSQFTSATAMQQLLSSNPGAYYDYNGIDPHMIEDYQDRTAPNPGYNFTTDASKTAALASASTAPANPDPINGREWVTDKQSCTDGPQGPDCHVLQVDRQYACTFPLATPRDCTQTGNQNSCDCPTKTGGLTPQQLPPLCNPNTPTQQVGAKAYPTIRELQVARMLGGNGIVSSLCPMNTTDTTGIL